MIDFLYIHKNWFYKKYFLKLQKRYFTFHIALNCFLQIGGKTIIETGCVRNKNDWGAGNSTVVFGDFCKRYKYYTQESNINLNKERSMYKWKEDKNGNVLDEPVKFKDDLMDAGRMARWSHYRQYGSATGSVHF